MNLKTTTPDLHHDLNEWTARLTGGPSVDFVHLGRYGIQKACWSIAGKRFVESEGLW